MSQDDASAGNEQADLFGPAPQPVYRPDPDRVRRRLDSLIAEARAAEILPWSPAIVLLYREIVPRMSGYLPEEEGAQYSFDFENELKRLEAA